MKRIKNFFRLPFAEKMLLGESLFLVVFIELILRVAPFRLFKNLISKLLATKYEHEAVDWKQINRIVRSVRFVSSRVSFVSCLTQALAAMLLINSKGQHSELKIGVVKDETKRFKAHAWLETDGRIIIGRISSQQQYKVLNSFSRNHMSVIKAADNEAAAESKEAGMEYSAG